MTISITQGQYDALPSDRRATVDGHPMYRAVDLQTYETILIPVRVTDRPEPIDVPEHYTGTWPLDPRD